MYRNYGLYLVEHFVVALTNVCTVRLAQLHSLICFKIGGGDSMACRAEIASKLGETFFLFCLIIVAS